MARSSSILVSDLTDSTCIECTKCGTTKHHSQFVTSYSRGAAKRTRTCKDCKSEPTRAFKRACVEYKGGECFYCGLIGHDSLYDFHHIDPATKLFSIADRTHRTMNEHVLAELDKCALLCANCHRLVHAGEIELSL